MDLKAYDDLYGLCPVCGSGRAMAEWTDGVSEVRAKMVCEVDQSHDQSTPRRVRVNGKPYGTISWAEHVEAWVDYHRFHPMQDARRIAERGGFGLTELVRHLGRMPLSWEPNAATKTWWRTGAAPSRTRRGT